MQKILIHTCCAPCLCYPYKILNDDGFEITALWYNPNIHPFPEYTKRLNTLYSLQTKKNIDIIYQDDYDINEWLSFTRPGWEIHDKSLRCRLCYTLRLKKTVQIARKKKINYFTTTLLYSKYQFHDLIIETGEALAKEYGLNFLYRDFREGWQEGITLSHEYGLYRQKYCGCIFSEAPEENNKKKK